MPVDFFSGKEIPKGQGLLYVKKDGTLYWFANKKSEKNFLKLGRSPASTKWTMHYHKEKHIMKKAEAANAAKKRSAKGEAK